jgi:predicted phage terminase large subunit-like protein
MLMMPPRHGKSDMVSRYLPPNFLGKFPTREVLLASYGAELSESFSRDARKIMRLPQYQQVYPGITIARESSAVNEWAIEGTTGKAQFIGLGGGASGKGADLAIVDDFLKSYEDGLSANTRDKMWNGFTDDIMTRRAPVCIFILLATPRHVDDIFGRIKKRMVEEPNFPRFREIKYPARSPNYPGGYLFPEKFNEQYYLEQYATLSHNSAAALMDCDPQVRGGNVLHVEGVKIVDPIEWAAKTNGFFWARGWDLASSEEQRIKDDPDYTAGVKSAVRKIGNEPLWFIDDVKYGKWEAGRRNEIIIEAAILDGDTIPIGVEAFAGYKDAFTQIRDALQGRRTVQRVNLPGDKVAKATRLEPIFERGNVYIKRAPWNQEFIKQCSEFPAGGHDDIVDAGVVSYSMLGQTIVAGRI